MEDDRPFDATKSHLCDASEPTMGKWHTTSLVTAVKGILTRQPQFEHGSPSTRIAAFRAATDELTHRGLDSLSLVCYGMWDRLASSVISVLVQSAVVTVKRPGGCRAPTPMRGGQLLLFPRVQVSRTLRHPVSFEA